MRVPSRASLRAVPRPSRRAVRVGFLVVLLVGVVLLANSALASGPGQVTVGENGTVPYGAHVELEERINTSNPDTEPIPADAEVTVIATQGFFPNDENAELVAVGRDGSLFYHNNTYGVYFDVDPVPGTRYTVEYVAAEKPDDCACTINVIERVNLSTGAVERIYAERTPGVTATRWHDADRLNDTHLVLADIYRDSVRIVNVSSGETTWEWKATNIYDYEGDTRPQDWTHVNDVEVVDDGTFMLSMRNQDEVVFVERGEGYQAGRTLGEDGNHDILYEQHNPDYLPAEEGGPAVLVADSENNRVVEYHREGGEWVRTWTWKDATMQWPRDADRLPNNRTLLVDSHGDRLLEVSPNGSIAWSADVGMPYDVERLGTGDESAGGHTVGEAYSGTVTSGPVDRLLLFVKDVLPSKLVNGALFSASAVGAEWFGFADLVVLLVVVPTALLWLLTEYRWANWSVTGLARAGYRRGRARL